MKKLLYILAGVGFTIFAVATTVINLRDVSTYNEYAEQCSRASQNVGI